MGRDVWLPSKKQEGGEWLKAQKGRELLACWDGAESGSPIHPRTVHGSQIQNSSVPASYPQGGKVPQLVAKDPWWERNKGQLKPVRAERTTCLPKCNRAHPVRLHSVHPILTLPKHFNLNPTKCQHMNVPDANGHLPVERGREGEGGTVNVIPTMKKPAASNFLPSTAASGGLWYIPPSPDCLGTNSGQLEELGAARTKEEGPTCPPRE